jgi:hypothetical protein
MGFVPWPEPRSADIPMLAHKFGARWCCRGQANLAYIGLLQFLRRKASKHMRFLVKVSFPVEAGNAAAKNGFKVIQTILEQQKPEAAYFIADGGRRTGILIIDMKDASDLPRIAEPWFLALNASIEATPAMVAEDLQKAAPSIEQAVKTFG